MSVTSWGLSPVPDFESVAGGVGDDGLLFELWMVAEEYGLFWV